MKKMWKTGKAFLRQNLFFAVFVAIQAVLLLLLVLSLFAKPVSFEITPEEMEVSAFGTFADDSQATEVNLGMRLPHSGAYRIEITYRSQKEIELFQKSIFEEAGYCEAYSNLNPSAIQMDAFHLDHGHQVASQRMWISFGKVPQDLSLRFTALKALLWIDSIQVAEQPIWRWTRLLGALLLFLLLDACYGFFFANGALRSRPMGTRAKTALLLGAITLLASLPLFTDFLFEGHDLLFHVERISLIAEELGFGQFPVRMQTVALNGYGYPSSLYYCDLFLYPFAVLYNCMVPMHTCYQLYLFFINGLTTLCCYLCFRRMVKDRKISLFGTALYVLSAYRLSNLYLRAAVGEYTAMTFFPLAALGIYGILKSESPTKKEWMPLALGMVGILQSHLLSAEIVTGVLAIYCIAHFSRLLCWRRIRALILAAAVACGLSLWFFIPLLHSMLTMPVGAMESVAKIQDHGLYLAQLFGVFLSGIGGSNYYGGGMQHEMGLGIGLSLMMGMGLSLYIFTKRDRLETEAVTAYRQMRGIFLIALLTMALTLHVAPWDALESLVGAQLAKVLSVMNLPWRLLGVSAFLLTITTMLSIKMLGGFENLSLRRWAGLMLCALVLVAGYFYMDFTGNAEEIHYYSTERWNTMDIGSNDYVLRGADVTDARYVYLYTGNGVVAEDYQKEKGVASFRCANEGEEEGYAVLPLWAYSNYHAYDAATGEELTITQSSERKVRVMVAPGYRGTVEVRYTSPAIWRLAELASAVTLLGILFAEWRERNKRKEVRTF